jgi:hypothetical protein
VLFLSRRSAIEKFTAFKGWLINGAAIIVFLLFALYNLRYLPVIDFLPYKIGNNIPELMKIPEGAPVNRYETTFIYEKDGIQKEFTLENYPADDSSWKFIDQKSLIVGKGYEPPIHDFSIVTMENDDITEAVLSNQGFTLLMVSRKLDLAKQERLKAGLDMGRICMEEGIDFLILTSSGTDEIKSYNPRLKFCQTDETALKTMVRSNPGFILLKNGIIAGKWSWANMPDNNDILKIKKNFIIL